MDQERIEKLFIGQEYMDTELLTKLRNYERFIENTEPVITVLCTENRLRMNMDKLIVNEGQAEFHVYGTYDGIEDVLEKSLYSDAVFVNTLALKIAPDGLYRILKELANLDKEIYFILSGWESIPKTSDMCKKKLLQIDNDFPFSKIPMSKNVFVKPLEGFYAIEDVLAEYTERCIGSFQSLHTIQEEALYKKLYNETCHFRRELCIEIQKEQAIIMQMQQIMAAKQKRYEITFSHATVGVNDIIERFERSLNTISLDDVLFNIESLNNCSAREAFIKYPDQTQRDAKNYICHYMIEAMDKYMENGTSSLETQTGTQVSDTVNDLLSAAAKLKKCRFVDVSEVDELTAAIESSSKLIQQAENYNQSIVYIFDNVRTALEAKIMAFQFDNNTPFQITDIISKLSSINNQSGNEKKEFNQAHLTDINSSKIGSINEEGYYGKKTPSYELQECGKIKNIDKYVGEGKRPSSNIMNMALKTIKKGGKEAVEISNENKEDASWTQFLSELERLIAYSKNTMSSLLYDNSRLKNEEIEVQCHNTVQEYFGFIIKQLNIMSYSLVKTLDTFGRNDL